MRLRLGVLLATSVAVRSAVPSLGGENPHSPIMVMKCPQWLYIGSPWLVEITFTNPPSPDGAKRWIGHVPYPVLMSNHRRQRTWFEFRSGKTQEPLVVGVSEYDAHAWRVMRNFDHDTFGETLSPLAKRSMLLDISCLAGATKVSPGKYSVTAKIRRYEGALVDTAPPCEVNVSGLGWFAAKALRNPKRDWRRMLIASTPTPPALLEAVREAPSSLRLFVWLSVANHSEEPIATLDTSLLEGLDDFYKPQVLVSKHEIALAAGRKAEAAAIRATMKKQCSGYLWQLDLNEKNGGCLARGRRLYWRIRREWERKQKWLQQVP